MYAPPWPVVHRLTLTLSRDPVRALRGIIVAASTSGLLPLIDNLGILTAYCIIAALGFLAFV